MPAPTSGQIFPTGVSGSDGTTWYEGSGPPSSSIGINNDLYLDTSGVGGQGWIKLAQQVPTGDVASIVFSGLSGTTFFGISGGGFTHLVLFGMGKITANVGLDRMYVQFNNDAGSNYLWQELVSFTTTVGGSSMTPDTAIRVGLFNGAAAARANSPGSFKTFIPFYRNTTWEKTTISESSSSSGGVTDNTPTTGNVIGAWENTAAINVITILPGSGNIKAGSLFALYGIT